MPRRPGKRDRRTGATERRHRRDRGAKESSYEQDYETTGKGDDYDDDDCSYSVDDSDEMKVSSCTRRKPRRWKRDKPITKDPDKEPRPSKRSNRSAPDTFEKTRERSNQG